MEIIGTVAEVISAITAMIAVWVAAKELTASARAQEEGLDRERKQATLDAYNTLQTDAFDRINQYTVTEIKIICEDTHSSKYKEIGGYLARIESFCIGIQTGIYDFDTFFELSYGYFYGKKAMLYYRLLPILDVKGRNADRDYYANIHEVWNRMEAKSHEEVIRIKLDQVEDEPVSKKMKKKRTGLYKKGHTES